MECNYFITEIMYANILEEWFINGYIFLKK